MDTHINGCWTWYNDPRVLALPDGRVVIGTVSKDAYATLALIDPDTGAFVGRAVGVVTADDHNNPAILRIGHGANAGKILAAWSEHAGASYRYLSDAADSIDSGTTTTQQTGTQSYAELFELFDGTNAHLYWAYRNEGANYNRKARVSTDSGATWGGDFDLISTGQQPYPKYRVHPTDPARLDAIFTNSHPDAYTTNSVYHFYIRLESGTLNAYDSAGNPITLPATPANATRIYDGSGVDGRSWTWEVGHDATGKPCVLFTCFPGATPGDDHRYRMARWNGSAWTNTGVNIATGGDATPHYLYSGEKYYSGGVNFGSSVDEVYLSRKVSGQFEIQRWTTADSGLTWAKAEDITSGSSVVNARPFYVPGLGARGQGVCFWWAGTYTLYNNYQVSIQASPALAIAGPRFALDRFDQAAADTPVHQTKPELGQTWTVLGGDCHISTAGRVFSAVSSASYYRATGSAPSADHACQFTQTVLSDTPDNDVGPFVRLADGITGYHARYSRNTNAIELFRCVSGAFTAMGTPYTPTPGPAVGETFSLRLSATGTGASVALSVKYLAPGSSTWTEVITASDTDAARITAANSVGWRTLATATDSTGTHLDNFQAFTLAALTAGAVGGAATGETTAEVHSDPATGGVPPYSYQWYRDTASPVTPGAGTLVSGATSLLLNDTGLTAGTTYHYVLRVTDADGTTADSAEATVTTDGGAIPLDAGTIELQSSGPVGIALGSTTAASGGTAPYTYQWERSDDGGAFAALAGQTGATCTDTTAVAGVRYTYRRQATDADSTTAVSNPIASNLYQGEDLSLIGSGGPRIGSAFIRFELR